MTIFSAELVFVVYRCLYIYLYMIVIQGIGLPPSGQSLSNDNSTRQRYNHCIAI